jgi:hypothetical protein
MVTRLKVTELEVAAERRPAVQWSAAEPDPSVLALCEKCTV